MRLPLIALIALLLAASLRPVLAQDFAHGLMATQQGEYRLAARIWHPLAEAGDPRAQFGMGTLYHEGLGVEQDLVEAAYWFHRASEQGMAEAQYNLGNAYKHGEGVTPSDSMAVSWWQKSAAQGFAPAQFNLGTSLLYGRGIAANPEQARYWYRQAADQGHAMAQEALAAATADETAPAAGPPAAQDGTDCAAWLAAQPAGHYSIQFMSSPDPAAAQEYRERSPLPEPYVICRYPHKGRTWYAVLWGSHADLAAARHAVAALPPERQAEQPWIRSIQSLRRARAAP